MSACIEFSSYFRIDLKNEETGSHKEQTDHQTKNLKLFRKPEMDPKRRKRTQKSCKYCAKICISSFRALMHKSYFAQILKKILVFMHFVISSYFV